MVGSFILGALKVMHRVMKEVISINTTVLKARDANRLLTHVLLLFSTDHMNFAAHFDGIVECIN